MALNAIQAAASHQVHSLFEKLPDRPLQVSRSDDHAAKRKGIEPDELSLGETRGLQSFDENHSLANLRFKSQLRVEQHEDGTSEIRFQSRLKFDYEFQSEDGTTIKVSAKVKSKLFYAQTGSDSIELKARVKFEITASRDNVPSILAPVLDSHEVTDGQRSSISTAVQQFADAVDGLTVRFLDDVLFGDDLIGSLVNVFNELSQAVQSALPTAKESAPVEAPLPAVSASVLAVPTALAKSTSTLVDSVTNEDAHNSDISTAAVADLPGEQAISDVKASGDEVAVPVTVDDSAQGIADLTDAEAPPVAPIPFAESSLLVNLRVNFVQSLTDLVSILDAPADDVDESIVRASIYQLSKLDLRLSAYSQTPPGGIDTHV